MWESIKDHWDSFHASFHDSEIIVWARLQYVFGAAYMALQSVDISQFVTDHQLLQYYVFANGFIMEMLRKNREDWGQGVK